MHFNQDFVPANLEQAIQELYETLEPDDWADIHKTDWVDYHQGFGLFIRNAWSLWDKETHLVQWFIKTYGLSHADDLCSLVLQGLWCKVRGTKHNIDEQVAGYKEHWAAHGIDPRTGQPIGP